MNWIANATKVLTGVFDADRRGGFTNRGLEDVHHDVMLAIVALKDAGLIPAKPTFLQDHAAVYRSDGLPSPGRQLAPHRWCLDSPGGCDCPRVFVSYSTEWLDWRE